MYPGTLNTGARGAGPEQPSPPGSFAETHCGGPGAEPAHLRRAETRRAVPSPQRQPLSRGGREEAPLLPARAGPVCTAPAGAPGRRTLLTGARPSAPHVGSRSPAPLLVTCCPCKAAQTGACSRLGLAAPGASATAAAERRGGEGARPPPCLAALPPPAEGRLSLPEPRQGREVTHRRRLRAALSSAAAAPLNQTGRARPLRLAGGKLRAALGGALLRRAGAPASTPRPGQRRGPSDSRAPPLRRQPGAQGRAAGRAAAYGSGAGAGRGGAPGRGVPATRLIAAQCAGPGAGRGVRAGPRRRRGRPRSCDLCPPAPTARCGCVRAGVSPGGLRRRREATAPSPPPWHWRRARSLPPAPAQPRASRRWPPHVSFSRRGPAAFPPPGRRLLVGPAGVQRGGQELTGPAAAPALPSGWGAAGRARPPVNAGAWRGVTAAQLSPPRLLPAGVLAVLCACPAVPLRSAPPWAGPRAGYGAGLRLRSRAAAGGERAPPWRRTRSWRGEGRGVRLTVCRSPRPWRGLSAEQGPVSRPALQGPGSVGPGPPKMGPRGLRERARVGGLRGPVRAAGARRCVSVCSGAGCGPGKAPLGAGPRFWEQ